ncbi:hypothetical protein ACVME5_008380 [Bradyrhizobium liaoningense]
MIRPVERLLCVVIVRNRNHSAKRKDVMDAGTCLNRAGIVAGTGRSGSIDSEPVPVHKSRQRSRPKVKIFTPNLPSVGLSDLC